jgi:hypothetical protein
MGQVCRYGAAQLAELKSWAAVQPAVVQRNSDVFSADLHARVFSRAQGQGRTHALTPGCQIGGRGTFTASKRFRLRVTASSAPSASSAASSSAAAAAAVDTGCHPTEPCFDCKIKW